MIIRPKNPKNTIIVGLFTSVSSFCIMVFILMLSKDHSLFEDLVHLNTKVENVQGLKLGAEVRLKGIKIGSVSTIKINSLEEIIINFHIKESALTWIKKDSYVTFRTQGVLGDKFIEILGGSADTPSITKGDTLSLRDEGSVDKFISKGEDILVTSSRVLQKLDIFMDQIIEGNIGQSLQAINNSVNKTNLILKEVNPKRVNSAIDNLSQSTAVLANIGKQIQEGPGTLNSLIYDRALHDDLQSVLGGAKRSKVLRYFIRESIKEKGNR